MMIDTVTDLFSTAISNRNPQQLAHGIRRVLAVGETYIIENRWELLDTLCIATDNIVANARKEGLLAEDALLRLADLAQQIIAVLQFVAHARGDRRTGNFITAQRQAKRLDTMTGGQFQLLALTELVPDSGTTPNITLSL